MTDEKRNKLKIAVMTLLVLFLLVYGFVMLIKYTRNNTQNSPVNSDIVFSQPNLQILSYKETLNSFPDRVALHYPYFLVIKPDAITTTIYNVQTKQKIQTVKQTLLDYFDGDIVYNNNGYHTYFNKKDLGVFCDEAFIVSKENVLCITRLTINGMANKLVGINSQTLVTHDLFASQNVLTAVYFIKNTPYIGEYNFNTNQSFIVVNEAITKAPDLINTFYQMDGKIYAASFKSTWNRNIESYDLVTQKGKNIIIQQAGKGRIRFN